MEYRFGTFLLDDKSGKVTSADGAEVKLRPQAFRLLEFLIKSYPHILSRDQIIDQVWGSEHLSSNSLPQVISELRQAIGDDPQTPRFIETVHRRGYRFIGQVEVEATRPALVPIKTRIVPRRRIILGALAFLALAGSIFVTAQLWPWRNADAEAESLPASETASNKALRLYFEGRSAERRFDFHAARELFVQAALLNPDARAISDALAQAEMEIGEDRKASSAAAALEQTRQAIKEGDLDRGDELGQQALKRARESKEDKLVALSLEQLASAALYRGQMPQALARLEEASVLHQQRGDRRALARNRELEAEVLVHQGDVDGALARRTAALAFWRGLDDHYEEAMTLQSQAGLLARTGQFDRALAIWQEANALFRQVGDRRGEATVASEVALVLTARGQLSEARELLSEALAYGRSTGNARDTARDLYSLAVIDLRTGRGEQARAELVEALATFRAAGDRMSACFVQRKLGDTLAQLGALKVARRELEAALVECRELGHRIAEGMIHANLGWLELHENDLRAARSQLEAALAIRRSTSDHGNAADDELMLAELELAEGRPALALEKTQAAAKFFASQSAPAFEAQAVALAARAQAELGQKDESRTTILRAETLLAGTEDLQAWLGAQINLALARVILGDRAEAYEALSGLGERAQTLGYGTLARRIEGERAKIAPSR